MYAGSTQIHKHTVCLIEDVVFCVCCKIHDTRAYKKPPKELTSRFIFHFAASVLKNLKCQNVREKSARREGQIAGKVNYL